MQKKLDNRKCHIYKIKITFNKIMNEQQIHDKEAQINVKNQERVPVNKLDKDSYALKRFGETLGLLRKIHKLSQKEISKKLNIVHQNYAKYELGNCVIPIKRLKSIANVYNITFSELIGFYDGTYTLFVEITVTNEPVVTIKKNIASNHNTIVHI